MEERREPLEADLKRRKRYYVIAPSGMVTGGVELAHQMCCELLGRRCQAWMYYTTNKKEPVDVPADIRYEKYGTPHVNNIDEVETDESVVIIPEALSQWAFVLKRCIKVLWWMSVDNFLRTSQRYEKDYFDTLNNSVFLHLVQSQYAYQYLLGRGVPQEKILWVSDYISESYGSFQLQSDFRKDVALYNPRKGYEEIKPLIEKTNWLEWIPLVNLTEEQMIIIMEIAKVYVDFGNHPGKDRIPREAASCGCCVITNRKGSAAFYEDIPIPDCYKIDHVPVEYDRIAELLKDICLHWEEHSRNFDEYRKMISCEKQRFSQDVGAFVDFIESKGDKIQQI